MNAFTKTINVASSSLSAKRDGWEVSKNYSKLLQDRFSVGLVCVFFVPFSKCRYLPCLEPW